MVAMYRFARVGVVLLLCASAVSCGQGGSKDTGGGGQVSASAGSGANGGQGSGAQTPGGGGGVTGGGSGGGVAPGTPLRIPTFQQKGLPFYEGSDTWRSFEEEFEKECGGTLCVTLKRSYTGPVVEGGGCGYVETNPPGGAPFRPGDVILVIGSRPCPPSGSPTRAPAGSGGTNGDPGGGTTGPGGGGSTTSVPAPSAS